VVPDPDVFSIGGQVSAVKTRIDEKCGVIRGGITTIF